MKYTIDRIEDEFAVCMCENGLQQNLPLAKLYSDAKEGDCIIQAGQKYVIDVEETNRKRESNFNLQESLY